MDYCMPFCDGPDAVTKINAHLDNKRFKESERPYICFMTAYNEKGYKKRARQAGSDYFLVKPIFRARLQKLLQITELLI